MSDTPQTGDIAANVTSNTEDAAKIITGASEAAGAAFEVASVEKFKVHKDNPTQVPIGRKE
jgi:intracellular multiplication protein IcmD